MIIILFGLPGVGKNYIGDLLSKKYNFYFYDADKAMTSKVKELIKQNQIVSDKDREECFNIVVEKINTLAKKHQNIVIGQALLKNKHRLFFKKKFPRAIFILVKANSEIRGIRVANRKHHVSKEYAKKVKHLFEKSTIDNYVIENHGMGDKNITQQLEDILNKQQD